jgi:hypothetical protein
MVCPTRDHSLMTPNAAAILDNLGITDVARRFVRQDVVISSTISPLPTWFGSRSVH